MSFSQNLPTSSPTLNLNFANARALDPRITFTRSSSATRYNASGLIETVSTNVPRFDFDPVTLACRGLLIEEQRTNLLTYSEYFDNAAWTKTRSSITANAVTAPDGTTTADKLVEDTTASNSHLALQTTTQTKNATYSFSFYAKAAERTFCRVFLNGYSGNNIRASFDLVTGAVSATGFSGNGSYSSASAVSVGNGWFKCSLAGIPSASAGTGFDAQICLATDGTVNGDSYTGDGVSGIYVWGAQLEAGAFPTSYIPSTETFTSRASSGTYFNSSGLLTSASTNVARMDYNPTNLTLAPKLLLEAAATNLLTYSEQFDNAVWAKSNSSITADAVTAPDGTLTADKLIEDTANATHYVQVNPSVVSGTAYTASCYFKAAGRTQAEVRLSAASFGTEIRVYVDLNTGSTTTISGTPSLVSATSVGNGWWRLAVSATATASAGTGLLFRPLSGGVATYTGDGVSGIYIWGAQLEAGAFPTSYTPSTETFTSRASSGTYFNSSGVLTTAGTNVARMNYNPTNLTLAPKLLLEAAATNLLKYSDDFYEAGTGGGNWKWLAGTVTSNTQTAPDGTLSADTLTTTGGQQSIFQSVTVSASTAYTFSVFVKLGTMSASDYKIAIYNETGASFIASDVAPSQTPTAAEWTRISYSFTTPVGCTSVRVYPFRNGSTISSSTVHLWGAQLEAGSFPTSYIQTTTASATRAADVSSSATTTRSADVSSSASTTRAADVASMTGANFSSWYNQTEGTIYTESSRFSTAAFNTVVSISDGTINDRIRIIGWNDARDFFIVSDNNVLQAEFSYTSGTTLPTKMAGAYKENDFALSRNGATAVTDSSGTLPAVNQMTLGATSATFLLNGHIRRIAYYNTRLTNTQLQALTL